MKLVTLNRGQSGSPGAVISEGVYLDLVIANRVISEAGADSVALQDSVTGILSAGQLEDVRQLVALVEDKSADTHAALDTAEAFIEPADARLLAPIPQPSLILAHGMAYREHLEEMDVPIPEEPAWFTKAPSSVTGSGEPIILPRDHSEMVDWEGEFSIVIERRCHQVKPSQAMDYVAGYTIINDVSARKRQRAARSAPR